MRSFINSAIPCTKSEISYVSNLQDKHNASFFPYVLKRVASIRLQKSEIFLIIFYLLMLLFTFGIEFRVHSIFSVLYPV